ncbi:MAG: type II toxin-antitoxin system VapC family toxin [Herminiimonas sp.]|nr:type II toxin-antitoxin system VapC family toxin [Herminiimonas sp.]
MARYMLDTNMCIYLMKNQPPHVAARFAQCHVGDVVMSAITFAELEYGVLASDNPARHHLHLASLIADIPVAAFDAAAASAYGPIRQASNTGRKDQLDKLIASHAVSLGIVLVTNNVRDFEQYRNLMIENWTHE